MQQSNVIFAALFVAFIVYVTAKGELPKYINILTGKTPSTNTAPAVQSNSVLSGAETIEQQTMQELSQTPGIQIPFPAPTNQVP